MILVDYSSVKMRNFFGLFAKTYKTEKITSTIEFTELVKSQLFEIHSIFNNKYNEVVICCDSKPYWRQQIFPAYKSLRSINKNEIELHNMKIINKCADKLVDELPFKVVKVDKCEADDIIMVLAANSKEKTLIYSVDKDFIQMQHINDLVDQFSWKHNKFLTKDHFDIDLHILLGDAVDGVPCVWCDMEYTDDVKEYMEKNNIFISPRELRSQSKSTQFYQSLPQPVFKPSRIGAKRAAKLKESIVDPDIIENYNLNKQLVGYEGIPQVYKDEILDVFSKVQAKPFTHPNLITF